MIFVVSDNFSVERENYPINRVMLFAFVATTLAIMVAAAGVLGKWLNIESELKLTRTLSRLTENVVFEPAAFKGKMSNSNSSKYWKMWRIISWCAEIAYLTVLIIITALVDHDQKWICRVISVASLMSIIANLIIHRTAKSETKSANDTNLHADALSMELTDLMNKCADNEDARAIKDSFEAYSTMKYKVVECSSGVSGVLKRSVTSAIVNSNVAVAQSLDSVAQATNNRELLTWIIKMKDELVTVDTLRAITNKLRELKRVKSNDEINGDKDAESLPLFAKRGGGTSIGMSLSILTVVFCLMTCTSAVNGKDIARDGAALPLEFSSNVDGLSKGEPTAWACVWTGLWIAGSIASHWDYRGEVKGYEKMMITIGVMTDGATAGVRWNKVSMYGVSKSRVNRIIKLVYYAIPVIATIVSALAWQYACQVSSGKRQETLNKRITCKSKRMCNIRRHETAFVCCLSSLVEILIVIRGGMITYGVTAMCFWLFRVAVIVSNARKEELRLPYGQEEMADIQFVSLSPNNRSSGEAAHRAT